MTAGQWIWPGVRTQINPLQSNPRARMIADGGTFQRSIVIPPTRIGAARAPAYWFKSPAILYFASGSGRT